MPSPGNQPEPAPRPQGRTRVPRSRDGDRDRAVVLDDAELAAMAYETRRRVDWHSLILSARFGPERWQERGAADDGFRVFVRDDAGRFDVLALGVVPACVGEVLSTLESPTSAHYTQQMAAVFADQVHDAAILHHAGGRFRDDAGRDSNEYHDNDGDDDEGHGTSLVELTVKRVAFKRASWVSSAQEWTYLDAVFRQRDRDNVVVEKLLSTMQPSDVAVDAARTRAGSSAFHNVVCGYLLRAGVEDQLPPSCSDREENENTGDPVKAAHTRSTRVCFYGSFHVPTPADVTVARAAAAATSGWRRVVAASDKTIKQRLLKLALSASRLTALVRRQRLGIQVLVGASRFRAPTNTPCKCTRVLVVAQLCRVCGHGVCGSCSAKHERARQRRGSQALEISRIRVCANCTERVDQADYANLTTSSLLGTRVTTNATPAGKSPTESLRELLRETVLTTRPGDRKASAKSLIRRIIMDQADNAFRTSAISPLSSCLLTAENPDEDFVDELQRLEVDDAPVALRSDDDRGYQLDTSRDDAVPTPVPDDEPVRLEAVDNMNGPDFASVVELEILCELAAREMGCATSAISLIDRHEYYGVASNVAALRHARIPRSQTICSHTMMDRDRPHIVAHPEADIRFSKFDSVKELGVRFYCAFPLHSEGGHVIGTRCCLHGQSIEITETQLATFKKLAATASKVMQLEARKARRKTSSTSTPESA